MITVFTDYALYCCNISTTFTTTNFKASIFTLVFITKLILTLFRRCFYYWSPISFINWRVNTCCCFSLSQRCILGCPWKPEFRLRNSESEWPLKFGTSEPELRYLKPESVPILLLKFGILISEWNENFNFCFIHRNLISP